MTNPTTSATLASESGHGPDHVSESRTLWADTFHTLRRRPGVIISTLVAVFFLIVALFPTLFTSTDPKHCDIGQSRMRPEWFGGEHPFGTTLHGCDVLAQLVHGTRPSLMLALLVVFVSLVIGLILGTLSGFYAGSAVDTVISRALEVFLVIPFLLAALLILSMFRNVDFGTGQWSVILQPAIVLILFGWMGYTRYVRASVLEARNHDYAMAARVMGASDLRIMFRHVLPNAVGPVTALVPTSIASIISAEAVLAFLGIGVRPPAVSWGIMINDGAEWFTSGYPHLLLFPLGCLLVTILAFVVIGDALRDALDPKLR